MKPKVPEYTYASCIFFWEGSSNFATRHKDVKTSRKIRNIRVNYRLLSRTSWQGIMGHYFLPLAANAYNSMCLNTSC